MTATNPPECFTLDPDAIASFVKLQRGIFGWKQDTLASLAGVSHSTVQRVERGVAVRPEQLRKLAVALKKPEDEFLRERVRPTPEEYEENLRAVFASFTAPEGMVPVEAAPLRTEIQLRALLGSTICLFDSDLDPAAADQIAELREWFDLADFVQAERTGVLPWKRDRHLKVRKLWRDVLDAVEAIEREHCSVCIVGTYVANSLQTSGPINMGVIALRSRREDPSVSKLATLWAPQDIDEGQIFKDYLSESR